MILTLASGQGCEANSSIVDETPARQTSRHRLLQWADRYGNSAHDIRVPCINGRAEKMQKNHLKPSGKLEVTFNTSIS